MSLNFATSPTKSIPSPTKKPVQIVEDKLPLQAEFDWYNLDAEFGKPQPDIIMETDGNSQNGNEENDVVSVTSEINGNDTEKVEYNLDEEYQKVKPIIQPPDIIQKNGILPRTALTFKDLVALNDTPKMAKMKARSVDGNYEHFLDDSGLCSKPIILPRKKRVYYSGPFV
jgi:hypothetical protein